MSMSPEVFSTVFIYGFVPFIVILIYKFIITIYRLTAFTSVDRSTITRLSAKDYLRIAVVYALVAITLTFPKMAGYITRVIQTTVEYYFVQAEPIIGVLGLIALFIGPFLIVYRTISTTEEIAVRRVSKRLALYRALGLYFFTIMFFTAFYRSVDYLDNAAFSERLDLVSGLYFSVITMTTVWFGDIVPKSHVARVIVSIQALTGVLLNITLFAVLVSYLGERGSNITGES